MIHCNCQLKQTLWYHILKSWILSKLSASATFFDTAQIEYEMQTRPPSGCETSSCDFKATTTGWPGHHRGFLVGLTGKTSCQQERKTSDLLSSVGGSPSSLSPLTLVKGDTYMWRVVWTVLEVNSMFSDIIPVGMLGCLVMVLQGRRDGLFAGLCSMVSV